MTAPTVVLDAVVRLADATPGAELLDGDGERWTRTATGATYHADAGEHGAIGFEWPDDELDEVDELHGPFRLRPPLNEDIGEPEAIGAGGRRIGPGEDSR